MLRAAQMHGLGFGVLLSRGSTNFGTSDLWKAEAHERLELCFFQRVQDLDCNLQYWRQSEPAGGLGQVARIKENYRFARDV